MVIFEYNFISLIKIYQYSDLFSFSYATKEVKDEEKLLERCKDLQTLLQSAMD